MAFRFKRGKTTQLLDELDRCDLRLKAIALSMMGYAEHQFGKDLVITEIYRTEAEQRSYYPDRPYRPSVHQFGRGLDFGIRAYTAEELDPWPYGVATPNPALSHDEVARLDAFYSALVSYDDERPEFDSIIHHNVGLGDHMHIQVSWRTTTRLRSDRSLLQLIGQRLGVSL